VNIIEDGKLPIAQYRFEALINEAYYNPVQDTYYGPATANNVRIGYIIVRNEDPNAGHTWNMRVRLTIDGNVLTSALTNVVDQVSNYVYIPGGSDIPIITPTVTPIGVAFPCDAASFQVEARQDTEASGHGPIRILIRWWRL